MNRLSQYKSYIQAACILLVLVMHSYNRGLIFGVQARVAEFDLGHFFQLFFSHGLGRAATPMLFFLSGLFFFKDFPTQYRRKVERRIYTLLIPFLAWNFYCFILLKSVQANWANDFYFPFFYNFVEKINWWEPFYLRMSYPLWFLQDLMLMVIISPLIYLVLKRLRWPFLLSLFVASIFADSFPLFASTESLLYFSLGGMISLYPESRLLSVKLPAFRWVALSWLTLIAIKSLLHFSGIDNRLMYFMVARLVELGGIIVLGTFPWEKLETIKPWEYVTGASFIIYAAHVPLIDFIKFNHAGYSTLAYILGPVLLIVVLVVLDRVLRRIPRVHSLMTGKRG